MSRQPREKGRAGSYGIAAFLTFLGSAAGLVGWSRFAVNRRMDLPPALPAGSRRSRPSVPAQSRSTVRASRRACRCS